MRHYFLSKPLELCATSLLDLNAEKTSERLYTANYRNKIEGGRVVKQRYRKRLNKSESPRQSIAINATVTRRTPRPQWSHLRQAVPTRQPGIGTLKDTLHVSVIHQMSPSQARRIQKTLIMTFEPQPRRNAGNSNNPSPYAEPNMYHPKVLSLHTSP